MKRFPQESGGLICHLDSLHLYITCEDTIHMYNTPRITSSSLNGREHIKSKNYSSGKKQRHNKSSLLISPPNAPFHPVSDTSSAGVTTVVSRQLATAACHMNTLLLRPESTRQKAYGSLIASIAILLSLPLIQYHPSSSSTPGRLRSNTGYPVHDIKQLNQLLGYRDARQ